MTTIHFLIVIKYFQIILNGKITHPGPVTGTTNQSQVTGQGVK